MKVRLAAVISLSGVLVAGSAAALVNNQVLNQRSNFGAADHVQLAATTSPGATSTIPTASSSVASTGSSLPPADAALPPVVVPAATTQAAYQIGDAGTVTLDTAGNVLAVVVVVPNANWTLIETKSEDQTNIEVKLQSPTTSVEFHATLLFGVVGTSIETKNLAPDETASTVGVTPRSTTATSSTVKSNNDDSSSHDSSSHDSSSHDDSSHDDD